MGNSNVICFFIVFGVDYCLCWVDKLIIHRNLVNIFLQIKQNDVILHTDS